MWTTKLNTRLITTVFALGMCSTAFAGQIIYVEPDITRSKNASPADFQFDIQYPSIQAAIDAAADGDTIILAPGTFRGDGNRDIDFKGKAVTLRSTNPNEPNIVAATIIDCNGSEQEPHRGFYFHSEEDANSIIAGLTVINGVAWKGGAVLCSHSSPRFTDCVFRGNEAYDDDTGGGAMYNEDCSPTLIDCLFTDNAAYRGGGMTCDNSNATISQCTFIENSASYYGGGLYNYASDTTLTDCTFSGNLADGLYIHLESVGGQGGGVYNNRGSGILTNCTFDENWAKFDGGGMYNYNGSPTLSNSTFNDNHSDDQGGGMYNEAENGGKCDPEITNCTFDGNYASEGGGIYSRDSNLVLTDCIFSHNVVDDEGGGMQNIHSNPAVTGCTFSDNSAESGGGGMANVKSSPSIIDCTFSDNNVEDGSGGGIDNYNSSPTLTNCTFSGNSANDPNPFDEEGSAGGGMSNYGNSSPILTNCTFSGNSASPGVGGGMINGSYSNSILIDCIFNENTAIEGGGMYNLHSSPTLTNCTFISNSGGDSGGAMSNEYVGNLQLTGCMFTGNSAEDEGGGIDNFETVSTIIDCTFIGNSAPDGGGLYLENERGSTLANCIFIGNSAENNGGGIRGNDEDVTMTHCTFSGNSAGNNGGGIYMDENIELTNSIFWANIANGSIDEPAQMVVYNPASVIVNYCCVQGWSGTWGGTGNIDVDPLFADPENGDFHLKSQAGRWDMNNPGWVQDDVTSLCIDAGDPMAPIMHEPFPNGGIVNMGAYGGTAEASKSYFGEPLCEIIVAGDINGDCVVDMTDLSFIAFHWLEDNNP